MKKYQELFLEKFNFKPKVILDFVDLRQISNYDCGVTCLQQVLIYYGIEKREDELIKLTYEELDKRWHDVDDDNKTKNSHVMIVIRGEKKFNSEEIIHMD